MATAHINIGSNLGDRHAMIEQAVAAIERSLHSPARRSRYIETEPWGYTSPNRFLNLGISIDVGEIPPTELHRILNLIQTEINPGSHRDTRGGYADRAIDIDLIAVGEAVIDTDELTLPHPRMHLREFVLVPMAELEPEWIHPRLGATAEALLRDLRHT